ncbi:MAG: hypothetical protein M3Y48_15150 [Actinomycetota bacterium]|nr:hypothetical protein [Actinomycetota bacterium]
MAHTWLAAAAHDDISAGRNAALFFGPALAFALHAAADRPRRYERALESLDARVTAVTRRRLDQAHARIDRGDRPALAEFDLVNGLTCYGTPGVARAKQLAGQATADTDRQRMAEQAARSRRAAADPQPPGAAIGILEGEAGLALALSTAAADEPPASHWDTCLLLN